MRNLKLQGALTVLIGMAGTIMMSWSVFAEEPPRTVGFFGLLMFAVGIILTMGILLEFFFAIRKRKKDIPERAIQDVPFSNMEPCFKRQNSLLVFYCC